MSYDLHLFQPQAGPAHETGASPPDGGEECNPGPIDPLAEERKRHLVAALRAVNPALEPLAFDHEQMARQEGTSQAEARRRWRQIELNGRGSGNGIQITVFDRTASVTLPYWHTGATARYVWREIWSYLEVFQREGYSIQDPQLDRELDLTEDLDAVLDAYATGVNVVEGALAQVAQPRKPWWQFW